MKKLFYLFLIISFFSCKEENKQQTSQATTSKKFAAPIVLTPGKDTIKLPVVIPAGNPIITKLKLPIANENKLITNNSSKGRSHFTNYTTNDGLAYDDITCSILDKTGNIWFGTQGGGISRFDGTIFTNYTISHGLAGNSIFSITEDKAGNLWFGSYGGGVSKYDGTTFANFTTVQGLANNVVMSIIEDEEGNLWFGTREGVSRYNGKTFKNYTTSQGLANNIVMSIIEDKTGNIWFGSQGGGLSKYDGKIFTNYTTNDGLALDAIPCSIMDKTGNLWFGTQGGGVSKYDGKTFTNYTTTQGLANDGIMSITEDKSGNIWFGTYGGGTSRYDGKIFTNYTTAQGLSNNIVRSITKDKTGNLWFGTRGSGVSRYDGTTFTNYAIAHGLANNSIWSITEDKTSNLWFGTQGGGISRYDGKTFTNYTTAQGLVNNVINTVTEDKVGNLWFGTDGDGVISYDGKSFTNYTTAQGLSNNFVMSVVQDKTGDLWLGTFGGGVCKYDGKTFTNYTTINGLTNNNIWCITEDKTGNLLFGSEGGGVSRYDGKTFTNYTIAQGLANNTIFSIAEDISGNLWFGTNGGGVCRYDGKSFTNYTKAQGLPDDVVTQVVMDKNGKNIIIATNFGLCRGVSFTPKASPRNSPKDMGKGNGNIPMQNSLSNEELKNYDLILEIYNSATGYPVKDVNTGQNCLFQDSKGIYWAATGSDATALVSIDFNALNRNPKTPTPVLYNVKLNEESICYYSLSSLQDTKQSQVNLNDSTVLSQQEILTYGKSLNVIGRDSLKKQFAGIKFDGITKFYPIPQNLELPYEHNNVTFEFNAVQLSRSHLLNFQYMLEGYDKTWSPVLKKREATFGNINEGTYTFKLKAQYTGPDGNNEWSEALTYTFKVLPPWYRTWWMYFAYALTLIGIVYLIIKQQTKKLKQRQKELEQKIDIATEDIREQKYIIEEKHKEITDSINYAERIQRSFLATKELLDENLTDYFVFFKPKDIVSGDFYWASILSNDNFALVTADSTGHGVPGAIMSLLNITSIESAIKDGFLQPADILNVTRQTIIERLKKDGSAEGGKDGMDCSLISFDFTNKKLTVSAANNPVWIVRKNELGVTEAIEIKPDKMPVGKHDKDSTSFTQYEIQLQSGDVVYTLTDGFPDQFGGEKGKKFMSKNLRELLVANSHLPMHEQHQLLNKTFTDWVGNLEQVDDVCIIGIRI